MPKDVFTPMTPDQLRNVAKHIAESSAHLAAVADQIAESNFESLQVKTWGQMDNSIKFMESFLSAVRLALKEARQSRGDMPGTPAKEKRNGAPGSHKKKAGK